MNIQFVVVSRMLRVTQGAKTEASPIFLKNESGMKSNFDGSVVFVVGSNPKTEV
jgi:hypothetical protein